MSGPLKSTARKDLDTRIRCPGPSRHPDASILRVQWDQRENSALDLASGWKRENLLLKYSKAVDRAFDSGGMKRTAEIKKSPGVSLGFLRLAERTGLEPATPGVTGRYSNQLNYRSKTDKKTRLTFSGLYATNCWHFQTDTDSLPAPILASPRGFEPLYSP